MEAGEQETDAIGTESTADTSLEVEIDAMRVISTAFATLDSGAQARVLDWVSQRFGVREVQDSRPFNGHAVDNGRHGQTEVDLQSPPNEASFQYPAELFDAARPTTDMEKALVLAYWFQVCQGSPSFTSRQVNNELKDIGHGVGNITRALDGLTAARPALVIQLEKSGRTQQAQKKFKLTHEGLKRIQQMLSGAGGE